MNLMMALRAGQQAQQGNPLYARRMFGIQQPQSPGPTPQVYGTPQPINPMLDGTIGSRLRNGSLGPTPQTPIGGAGLPSTPAATLPAQTQPNVSPFLRALGSVSPVVRMILSRQQA